MSMNSQDSGLRPSSIRKRDAILGAALARFLEVGFERTSMDEIASASGVAKQTIYSRFGSKEDLFLAVIAHATDEAFTAVDVVAGDEHDLDAWLHGCAERLANAVLDPDIIRLRRLVIAESERFPAIAATFLQGGLGRTVTALAERIADFQASGALRAGNPVAIAARFNWLVLAEPVNRGMFGPTTPAPDLTESVRIFRAAYGVD